MEQPKQHIKSKDDKGNTMKLRLNVLNILRGKWVLVEFIAVLIFGEMGIND